MKISDKTVKNIIKCLLTGRNHRPEIGRLINDEFLQFAISFFKKIVDKKFKNKNITVDWYKKEFLNSELTTEEIIINAGLNKKTIHNSYGSSKREIVINVADRHYNLLCESIGELVKAEHETELTLIIKFKGVSVELDISESLIVINTLAVKRAQLRGSTWSSMGKRVEKPLMQTLCKLYGVCKDNYALGTEGDVVGKGGLEREIDFYLIGDNKKYKCEVKLMGKGNPEGADSAFARSSDVFIADKLSDKNKKQLDDEKIEWVELGKSKGFEKFGTVLANLKIPHAKLPSDIGKELEIILCDVLQ